VPAVAKAPTVLVTPFLNLTVPALMVKARVEPCVKASAKLTTPPLAVDGMLIGRSMKTPFVVIVLFAGPAKAMVRVLAAIVIDALSVTLPVRLKTPVVPARDPENPVQLKLLMLVPPLNVNVPEPAVMLALMFLGKPVALVIVTTREFAPEYVKFTVGTARKVAVVPLFQMLVAPSPTMLISNVEGWKEPVYPSQMHRRRLTVSPRVTVPVPEFASKKATSAAFGADAPEAPPDVADQLAVLVVFHVPEPPTQYLFAMSIPLVCCENPD
jgi:hypothetical protein